MSNKLTISINHVELPIKEYNGKRVVTFKEIDTVHERPDGTARKRFNDNRKHFIEDVDYFKVSASEFRTRFDPTYSKQATEQIILLHPLHNQHIFATERIKFCLPDMGDNALLDV